MNTNKKRIEIQPPTTEQHGVNLGEPYEKRTELKCLKTTGYLCIEEISGRNEIQELLCAYEMMDMLSLARIATWYGP